MYRYQITLDPRIKARLWDVQDFVVQQGVLRGWSDVKVDANKVTFTSDDKLGAVEAALLAGFPTVAKGLTVGRKPARRAKLLRGLYGLNDVPAATHAR